MLSLANALNGILHQALELQGKGLELNDPGGTLALRNRHIRE